MIAIDTGFLFALADRRDAWHQRAIAKAGTADEGWITTWPVLTETCHLLQRTLGVEFDAALMDDVAGGRMAVWPIDDDARRRIPALMRKYAKLPMDLADASLVLLAEHLGHGQILSTDLRDFKTYRWKGRKPFTNLLEEAP
jgi:predicted nucleic acid-binding protein